MQTFRLLFWWRSEAPFVFMYAWNSVISEEFMEFGIVGILLMVVDSLDGILPYDLTDNC